MASGKPIELELSRKHASAQSQQPLRAHQPDLVRRLSRWRERQLARHALRLAGEPNLVLDLSCAGEQFWPLLAEQANRVILAADCAEGRLQAALVGLSAEVVARIKLFPLSALGIELHENAVDSIFCLRQLHQIVDPEERLAMLREFHRVTRDTLIVSLWVDGNYKAWKRRRLEARRVAAGRAPTSSSRTVLARASIEADFRQIGFDILGHQDFLPGYAMWRVYVLRKAE